MDDSSDEFDEEERIVQIQANTCKYDTSCHVCSKVFSCKKTLIIHLRIHNNSKPYMCHVCFKKYASNASLRGHFLTHPEIKRGNCTKCSAVIFPGSFVKHSCTRLPENSDFIFRDGKFICRKCGDAFTTKDEYGQHRKSHTPKSYTCEMCQMEFYKKRVFMKHMKVHDGFLGKNESICPECKKTFPNKKSLNRHHRIEHLGVRHSCHICSKEFRHRKSLRDHLDKHSQVKSHKCEICLETFSYKSSLDNHKKLHESNAEFKCCNRQFISAAQLAAHNRQVHLKERRYKCFHCDKTYLQKSHLAQHMRTHADSSYVCELCSTQFTHKQSYNHHMKLHYEGKQFKCDECNKKFATNYKLKRHTEVCQNGFINVVD